MAVPLTGPGEVRIAVRAAGVNPFDHKVYSGELLRMLALSRRTVARMAFLALCKDVPLAVIPQGADPPFQAEREVLRVRNLLPA
ncbi:hypothetical protein N4G67_00990 [Streptomyces violarus]|nr:hypothetical protein [Streptomyces violarus]MCT9137662.1 hypothetical protein [Streptomyces violarus]